MSPVRAFRYSSPAFRLYVGAGSLEALRLEVSRAHATRPLVICGPSIAGSSLIDAVQRVLGGGAQVFGSVARETPLPAVEEGARLAVEADADLLVAVGGGSTMVTARAIAIAIGQTRGQWIPIVGIPTTPTSATNRAGAGVHDPRSATRTDLFEPRARPVAVIVDDAAVWSCPAEVCRNAAATSLCTAAEMLTIPDLNAVAFADLRTAVELLVERLPLVGQPGDDPSVRVDLAIAGFLVGRSADALVGISPGVTPALAHELQARCGVTQGAAYSALISAGLRYDSIAPGFGALRLAQALGGEASSADPSAMTATSIGRLTAILGRTGLPTRLRDVGIPRDSLDDVAGAACASFFATRAPRPPKDPAELRLVLDDAW